MKNSKIYRITFSESLAQHILKCLDDTYSILPVTIKVGRRLKDGETSSSGLYGIVATRNDRLLRVSLSKDIAEFMCNDDSRYLAECYVLNEQDVVGVTRANCEVGQT